MKKISMCCIIATLICASLVGCSKKETVESIRNEMIEQINNIKSVNYSTDIDLELTSLVYGEKMKMMYKGTVSTDRLIDTGELHSFSDYSTQAFDDKYSEQIESYVKLEGNNYKQYSTFDGQQYYWLGSNRNQDEDKYGPLKLADYILDESKTTDLDWEYINGKKDDGYIVTSIVKGDYIRYVVDKTSMSGLIDFKNSLNEIVTANATLRLDKNKVIKSIELSFRDTGNLFPSIIGGMDKDSVESTMEHFSVKIYFDALNNITEIVLPENTADAVETDNITNFSVQVTSNEKVESETYNTVRVGNLKFEVPSNWEEIKSGVFTDTFSSGGHKTASKEYKHTYSTSVMKFTGGKSVFNWEGQSELGLVPDKTVDIINPAEENLEQKEEDLVAEVTDSTSETESVEDIELAPVFEIEPKKYLEAKLESVKGEYDSITLIEGDVSYIIGNKESDNIKQYGVYLTDGRDEYEILVTFDHSNLYKDYYDESLTHLLNSFKLLVGTTEDENYKELKEEEPDKPEVNTNTTVDNIIGSQANPYKLGDTININIIDMSTGNIASEAIKVNGVLKDKIIVNQKIKEHENKTGDDLSEYTSIQLVQFSVATSGYSYTDDTHLNFSLNTEIVKDGKVYKSITDDSPLGMTEMILTENDRENEFTMAYDIDNISHSLIKITYADPDLGDTEIYITLN